MLRILSNEEAAARVPHKLPHRAQLILAAGKSDQGKTWFVNRYMETLEPRVLALDPENNFPGIREASVKLAFEDLQADYAVRRRIVPPYEAETEEWAEDIFRRIKLERVQDLFFELDEVSMWINHRREISAAAKQLVLQGRFKLGLRILATSQILSYIPAPFQSQATDLVIFNTTRPADLKVIAQWSEEAAERAPSLKPRECFYLSL